MAKSVLVGSIIILLIAIFLGIFISGLPPQTDYKFSDPQQIVKQYFESWNKKDWPNMYATISDGFKKIEPTAKTLSDFRSYAEGQGIPEVKILNLKEETNDGSTAVIQYKVEFTLSGGTKKEFSDKFSLKYREADVIKGWKLIHPYGENIDTS